MPTLKTKSKFTSKRSDILKHYYQGYASLLRRKRSQTTEITEPKCGAISTGKDSVKQIRVYNNNNNDPKDCSQRKILSGYK